jgi:hypothetical protein
LTSHTARGVLVKPKLTKTKWVLMRLDATTLTENKSAILNIQKRNKNSLPGEKQNKFSALKTFKIKKNKTTQRILFSLFPKTCSFLGLVHFLYCTYCVHTM